MKWKSVLTPLSATSPLHQGRPFQGHLSVEIFVGVRAARLLSAVEALSHTTDISFCFYFALIGVSYMAVAKIRGPMVFSIVDRNSPK